MWLYYLLILAGVGAALVGDLFFRSDHLLYGSLCYTLDSFLVYYLFRENKSLSLAVVLWESTFIVGGLVISRLFLHEYLSPRKIVASILALAAIVVMFGDKH